MQKIHNNDSNWGVVLMVNINRLSLFLFGGRMSGMPGLEQANIYGKGDPGGMSTVVYRKLHITLHK
ncbi:hypothetical protein DMN77_22320 [Paenibacillus sp. 79R4]|nr:hypothetical protein [Paenibacillus sp. 79R4]